MKLADVVNKESKSYCSNKELLEYAGWSRDDNIVRIVITQAFDNKSKSVVTLVENVADGSLNNNVQIHTNINLNSTPIELTFDVIDENGNKKTYELKQFKIPIKVVMNQVIGGIKNAEVAVNNLNDLINKANQIIKKSNQDIEKYQKKINVENQNIKNFNKKLKKLKAEENSNYTRQKRSFSTVTGRNTVPKMLLFGMKFIH